MNDTPGPPDPKDDDKKLKEIENQVHERIKDEEQIYPDVSLNNGRITSGFIDQCLQCNQLGMGVLYTVVNKDKVIFNVTTGKWMRFNGVHWDEDDFEYLARTEDVVERLLKEVTDLNEKISWTVKKKDSGGQKKLEGKRNLVFKRISALRDDKGRNASVKFAISCRDPITIKTDEFDINPWLLGCVNGIIDLRSGKCINGEPHQYINKITNVEWKGLNAPAPLWEKFILDIMADDKEMASYLGRLLGYSIAGIMREHILPIFLGRGRNGKGTLIKILNYIMGELSGSIQTEMILHQKISRSSQGPSPDIVDLKGLRMAFAAETEEGQVFSASKVKWLTGGDQLVGRGVNEKKQTRFYPTHTLFLSTNNKPSVAGDDYAFWARVHLVPFRLSYVLKDPEELEEFERIADPEMDEKLKDEASGILAWLVRGCLEYQKRGLDPPDIVRKATLEYKEEEDILGNFLNECCQMRSGIKSKSSDLYDKFDEWFKKNISKKGITQKRFGRMMKKRFEHGKINGVVYYRGVELDSFKVANPDEGDDQVDHPSF